MDKPPSRSFTMAFEGRLNVLMSHCGISLPYHPKDGGTPPSICDFRAIWDTGATQKVVDTCNLNATGMAIVQTANGPTNSETYLVNIFLPNKVVFSSVRVTKGGNNKCRSFNLDGHNKPR